MQFDREYIFPKLLAITRIALAWLMIWPFFDKLFGLGFQTPSGEGMIDGGSPSEFVAYADSGLLESFWNSLGGEFAIDILMMLGLIAIGLAMLLGVGTKITCIAFSVFLLLMYSLNIPPVDNPLIDYHITWILFIWVIYFGKGFENWSLYGWWKEQKIVKMFPILE